MKPCFEFSNVQRDNLSATLAGIRSNPYRQHEEFRREIGALLNEDVIAANVRDMFSAIRDERRNGGNRAFVIRNCPVDRDLPEISNEDPFTDKHRKKTAFIGETFMALYAAICSYPILSYGDRSDGDFFTDVIEITKFKESFTGYSGGDLVYHVDRAPHEVRSDYVNLLGLRCPENNIIYTNFIDVRELLRHLSDAEQDVLRASHFVTQVDALSRSLNADWLESNRHPIINSGDSLRYIDTLTNVHAFAPGEAKDALIAFKSAVARSKRIRHKILVGDLMTFPNRYGLHNRELIEEVDTAETRSRWLLKIYTFENVAAANDAYEGWGDRAYVAV